MSITCFNCGYSLPVSAKYCNACGATVGAANLQDRTVVAPMPTSRTVPANNAPVGHKSAPSGHFTFVPGILPAPMPREHLILVIDTSGSMDGTLDHRFRKIEAAIRAGVTLVLQKGQIDPNDMVGVISFTEYATCRLRPCAIQFQKPQIIQALQGLTADGGTDINEGLKCARDSFDWNATGVTRRIVLLTDGKGGHPLRTAESLKSNGVIIDCIGVGDRPGNVDEPLLRAVASTVQGELHYRFIKDQATLVDHYTQLANKTAIGN